MFVFQVMRPCIKLIALRSQEDQEGLCCCRNMTFLALAGSEPCAWPHHLANNHKDTFSTSESRAALLASAETALC